MRGFDLSILLLVDLLIVCAVTVAALVFVVGCSFLQARGCGRGWVV